MVQYNILYEHNGSLCVEIPSDKWLEKQIQAGMTEEQAMEKLALKVVPPEVLYMAEHGNRRVLSIVPENMVPTDRTFRDAWEFRQ